MKSKRRHELQTNDLADRLGHWIEKVRPHLTTAALIAVAAAVILGTWYFVTSNNESQVVQAWRAYMLAGSNPQGDMIKELNVVADEFSDTQAGLWAAQTAADVEAGQAIRMLFAQKATAETGLDNAIKDYQKVLDSEIIKNSPMLQRRAHFGLAQALEASGELKEAIKHYEAVLDGGPDSALAKVSRRRVDRLSQDATKKWYNWLANQTPKTREPASSLLPGADLGAPASNLDTLLDGPRDDFMKNAEADDADSAAPSNSAAQDGAASKTPAKKEAEPAKTDATPIDGPQLDSPAVEQPKVEPPKKTPTATEKKGGEDQ